jgi:hypothetical protein
VALAQTDVADKNDIGFFLDEAKAKQMADLHLVDTSGPTPIKLFQRCRRN